MGAPTAQASLLFNGFCTYTFHYSVVWRVTKKKEGIANGFIDSDVGYDEPFYFFMLFRLLTVYVAYFVSFFGAYLVIHRGNFSLWENIPESVIQHLIANWLWTRENERHFQLVYHNHTIILVDCLTCSVSRWPLSRYTSSLHSIISAQFAPIHSQ